MREMAELISFKDNGFYEDLVIELNQDCWLDDSEEEEQASSVEAVNVPRPGIISTEKPYVSKAREMDEQSKEITFALKKSKIIFEPSFNGSIFPVEPPKLKTTSKAQESSSKSNGYRHIEKKADDEWRPLKTTSKAQESSSKSNGYWLIEKKADDEWRPLPATEPFSVIKDNFPALGAKVRDEWRPLAPKKPFHVRKEDFPAL